MKEPRWLNSDMFSSIKEKAIELSCIEEISKMSEIQAIRYIQKREGNSTCYARDYPLITKEGPWEFDTHSCSFDNCKWKFSCDRYRLMHLRPGIATRKDIELQADRNDCIDDILNLSDVDAIRFIQQKGGYTPCYASEKPLIPNKENTNYCSERNCYWIQSCDSHRNNDVINISKELSTESYIKIEEFQNKISNFEKELNEKTNKTVGLQIKSFTNLSNASKKMLVASPKTIVGESLENPSILKKYLLKDNSKVASYSGGADYRYDIEILFSIDIVKLSQWLTDTDSFIKSGNLGYYPIIHRINHVGSFGRSSLYGNRQPQSFWTLPKSLELKSFIAPHIGVPDGDLMLTHTEFAPILNIDLPVLENIDFNVLFKLMSDFPEELCTFRDFLHSKIEDMRQAAVGSEQFTKDCKKLEREIRDHTRKLNSDYKKAKLKAAFSLTGCVVAGWTLALYCFLNNTVNILTVLGPGGLAYTANAAYSEYLTKQLSLKDDPVYFLWVLGKTKNKK